MGNRVNVVVIDSGVYTAHPKIGYEVHGYSITKRNGALVVNEDCNDEFGHGTAIFGIIEKHCPEANIIPIKIFKDSRDVADIHVLIAALEFIEENILCDIINMSVGVSILKEKEELYRVCKRLEEKGVLLISAYDNFGSISYPAKFDCVMGVSDSELCRRKDDFIYVKGSKMINILANGNMQRCLWKEPIYQICGGNSFACAHFTGIIAQNYYHIKKDYGGKLYDFLKTECLEQIEIEEFNYNKVVLDYNQKRAVIFPFNKENHSLIRYQQLLSFEIVNIYDSKYSGKVGAYTNDLLKTNFEHNYLVKNIDNINFDDFDLLILGHTEELERVINSKGFAKRLIERCLKQEKMVYSYDEHPEFRNNKNFYNPNVKWKDEYKSPLGKLYRSSTPTVGVFGTTSKQGKFSLQLILREKFINDGYSLGQISSEPSGLLFNMDFCFPFGYAAKSNITRKRMVQYLNILLHDLDDNKDIILVGCQSSTLPYDNGNIDDFTFSQIEFLFSTSPDCVVLCVNQFDTLKDIDRTIKFIEASINTKVVALVVYPMKLRNETAGIYSEKIGITDEEKESCLKILRKEFNLPVFILGEKMDELYSILIDFFE